jgi:hypothetical protein
VSDKAVRVTARQRPRTKATYSPNTRTSTYFHVLWTVRCPEINVLMNPACMLHVKELDTAYTPCQTESLRHSYLLHTQHHGTDHYSASHHGCPAITACRESCTMQATVQHNCCLHHPLSRHQLIRSLRTPHYGILVVIHSLNELCGVIDSITSIFQPQLTLMIPQLNAACFM